MAQLCPFCKTRLWTDPLFSPARLKCPRCGSEFKPTVPWVYFRLLLLLVIVLGLVTLVLIGEKNVWLVVFLLGVAGCLWLLPRIIDLQRIGPELTPSEGILPSDLPYDDLRSEGKREELDELRRFRTSIYVLIFVALIIIIFLLALRIG